MSISEEVSAKVSIGTNDSYVVKTIVEDETPCQESLKSPEGSATDENNHENLSELQIDLLCLENERSSSEKENDVISIGVSKHLETVNNLQDSGDYNQAIICINKAINLQPDNPVLFRKRAELFLLIADFQSAILNYKRSCMLEPKNLKNQDRLAFIYFLYGQCLFDQRLFLLALDAFARATDLKPDNLNCFFRSITCLAALGHHSDCIAMVNSKLDGSEQLSSPVRADLLVLRARFNSLFGNTTLSYYDVCDALDIDSSHAEASALKQKLESKAVQLKDEAVRFRILGQNKLAVQKLSQAIDNHPMFPDLHILRGAIYRNIGDYNLAIDDYLLAMNKSNYDEDSSVYKDAQRQLMLTYNDFAVDCSKRGYYEEAVLLLNKAIKDEKMEAGLYLNRGDCFFQMGNYPFALADFNQALEMDPNILAPRKRISEIHDIMATKLFNEKNYQDAEKMLNQAINSFPIIDHQYIMRSKIRELRGNFEGAKRDATVALLLNPQNNDGGSLMARLYPGKSLSDVMTSDTASNLKLELDELMRQLGIKSRRTSVDWLKFSEAGSSKQKELNSKKSAERVALLSSLTSDSKRFEEEQKFNYDITLKKKKMKEKIQKVLKEPVVLKRDIVIKSALPRIEKNQVRQIQSMNKRVSLNSSGCRTFSKPTTASNC